MFLSINYLSISSIFYWIWLFKTDNKANWFRFIPTFVENLKILPSMVGSKDRSNRCATRDAMMEMEQLRFNISESNYLKFKVVALLVPNLILDFWSIYMSGATSKVYYLTCIGITLVTISLILSCYISYWKIHNQYISTGVLRVSHILFEISFTYQLLITVVYWSLLHSTAPFQEGFRTRGLPYYIYSCWNHSGPIFCMAVQFVMYKKVFITSDLKYLIGFGLSYILNNFLQTKWFVREPYFFLTWEGIDSLAAVGVICIVSLAIYYPLAKLSELVSKH